MHRLLVESGLGEGQHVLVHSAFKRIRKEYSSLSVSGFIKTMQDIITPEGSLIMPAFTYNWKPIAGSGELFDRLTTPSKTGAVSECFRNMQDVERTSSPTHSFSLWGKVRENINYTNSPSSPLGKGSIPDWLANKPDSFILLAGTDFSSLSFGHYLEVCARVPWFNYSPWHHLNISDYGAAVDGEQRLVEIPGCSKSFVVFEEYLLKKGLIKPLFRNNLRIILIPVSLLLTAGIIFFREFYPLLLCREGSCIPCNARRKYLNKILETT